MPLTAWPELGVEVSMAHAPEVVAEAILNARANVVAAWTEFSLSGAGGVVPFVQQTPTATENGRHTATNKDTVASIQVSNLGNGNHTIYFTLRTSQASGVPSQQIAVPSGGTFVLNLGGTDAGRAQGDATAYGPRVYVYGHADGVPVQVTVATFRRRENPR